MESELKILYKDESGELDLGRKIGKCFLYVFNDGDKNNNRYWFISEDKRVMYYFDFDNIDFEYTLYFYKNIRNKSKLIELKPKMQRKILNYIQKPTGEDSSIWSDMLNARMKYFGGDSNYVAKEINKYTEKGKEPITEFDSRFINLGNRLGKCKIKITNVFTEHPSVYIMSYECGFNSFISLLNGSYLGLDKLTDDECKILYDFMKSKNTHFGKHNQWIEFLTNTHIKEYEPSLKYEDFYNIVDIPRFDLYANNQNNLIKYDNSYGYKDYLLNLLKREK